MNSLLGQLQILMVVGYYRNNQKGKKPLRIPINGDMRPCKFGKKAINFGKNLIDNKKATKIINIITNLGFNLNFMFSFLLLENRLRASHKRNKINIIINSNLIIFFIYNTFIGPV